MTKNTQHLSDVKFTDFALPDAIQLAIHDLGYEYCTPIQAKSLPVIMEKRNIIGQANTGTGKTATFLIAVINQLLSSEANGSAPGKAIILSPTRELAIQIHKECEVLIKHTNLNTQVIYGGADYDKQKKRLALDYNILIGTVGRIIDFNKQRLIDLKTFNTIVLDEADRMLDMGFIKDVRFIMRRLPPATERLNLLFSATINFQVQEFAYEMMDGPELISVETEANDSKIEQAGFYVANEEKIPFLIGMITHHKPSRSIVFTNMKSTAEKVTAYLNGNNIKASLLSGDVPQKRRQALVKEFAEGKFPVLVATDVAARGLHIHDVSHVFNFDLPQDPEDYVHRIGRTGRIGSAGHAYSMVCENGAFYLPAIEEFTGNKIPIESVSSELLIKVAPPVPIARKKNHGGNRSSNSKNNSRHRKPKRSHSAKPANKTSKTP